MHSSLQNQSCRVSGYSMPTWLCNGHTCMPIYLYPLVGIHCSSLHCATHFVCETSNYINTIHAQCIPKCGIVNMPNTKNVMPNKDYTQYMPNEGKQIMPTDISAIPNYIGHELGIIY